MQDTYATCSRTSVIEQQVAPADSPKATTRSPATGPGRTVGGRKAGEETLEALVSCTAAPQPYGPRASARLRPVFDPRRSVVAVWTASDVGLFADDEHNLAD